MKAVVMNAYGGPDVLEIKEVARPEVGDDGVLIRTRAVSVNAGDCFSLAGRPWPIRFEVGFPRPKDYVIGWDVAGEVVEVGAKVTRFQPGDAVYAGCSHTFAELVCASEGEVALAPKRISLEETATMPTAAVTALRALRDRTRVKPGQSVLVNGASGGVGTFAVQIARALGAEVAGVCSTRNLELVRTLGADRVFDYTRENFTRDGQRWDVILDNVGSHSFAAYRRALKPDGVHLPNTGHAGMGYVFKAFALAALSRRHARPFLTVPNHADLAYLAELVDDDKLSPVVDKVFPVDDVRDAFRYVLNEHPRGKIVVRF